MPLPITYPLFGHNLSGFAVTGPNAEETEAALNNAQNLAKLSAATMEQHREAMLANNYTSLLSMWEANSKLLSQGRGLFVTQAENLFVSDYSEAKSMADAAATGFTRIRQAAVEFTKAATTAEIQRKAATLKASTEIVGPEELKAAQEGLLPYAGYQAKQVVKSVTGVIPWWAWVGGASVGLAVLTPYLGVGGGRK